MICAFSNSAKPLQKVGCDIFSGGFLSSWLFINSSKTSLSKGIKSLSIALLCSTQISILNAFIPAAFRSNVNAIFGSYYKSGKKRLLRRLNTLILNNIIFTFL
jgi:hypothetical protein